MEKPFKPGDRVEHSDGKIGTVLLPSAVYGCWIVRWDDGWTQTARSEDLHFIRSAVKK